jgi:hypothetical protein
VSPMGGGGSKPKGPSGSKYKADDTTSKSLRADPKAERFQNNYGDADQLSSELKEIYDDEEEGVADETAELLFELIPFCGTDSSQQAEEMVIKILQGKQKLPKRPRDGNGSTLLMVAATAQAYNIVAELLSNDISSVMDPELNAQNVVGQTALHISSCLDTTSYDITEALLTAGAHYHKVDLEGCTPLHYAAAGGESSIVALLLMFGAGETVDVIDCRGYTALDYACNMNHTESVQLLYDMGHEEDELNHSDVDTREQEKRFWKQFLDPATGRKYYHNLLSGVTTWDQPDCLKKFSDFASAGEAVRKSVSRKDESPEEKSFSQDSELIDRWRQIAFREGCRRVVQKTRREQQRLALQQAKAQQHLLAQGSKTKDSVKEKLQMTENELKQLKRELTERMKQEETISKTQMEVLKKQLVEEQEKRFLAMKEVQNMEKKMKSEAEKSQWTAEELKKAREQAREHSEKMQQAKATADAVKRMKEQNEKIAKQLQEEQKLRRKYYNQVEDLKGKIRVFCRIRPLSKSEIEKECKLAVSCNAEVSSDLVLTKENGTKKPYAFDVVFGPKSSQAQVFADTKKLVQSAVDGFNVCIFAYGQTGSGKTFTLSGPTGDVSKWMECAAQNLPETAGIQPRSIHELFRIAKRDEQKYEMSCECNLMELYRDGLVDLFATEPLAEGVKLKVKKTASGIVYVENSVTVKAATAKHMLQLLSEGVAKRHVASTKMNHESSRSHLIFSILIKCKSKVDDSETVGKLTLVDLAGSERLGKTGATGDTLKEALAINKSLSALGDVISALTSGAKHIPYRNHTLTEMMSDSLGGNAKTLMFVNASPADYNSQETESSLLYAGRVKAVKNSATKDNKSEVDKLKKQLALMKAKLSEQQQK